MHRREIFWINENIVSEFNVPSRDLLFETCLDPIIPAWFDVLQHLLGLMFYNTCNSTKTRHHEWSGKTIKRKLQPEVRSRISRLHLAMSSKDWMERPKHCHFTRQNALLDRSLLIVLSTFLADPLEILWSTQNMKTKWKGSKVESWKCKGSCKQGKIW